MPMPHDAQLFTLPHPFTLEQGGVLSHCQVAYHTFGTLNATGDNVVWVFHALTANSDPTDWWAGVVGSGTTIDPTTHFIVCANVLGSFYGSTCPRSVAPETEQPYGLNFPRFTVRDVVALHHRLREHLGVQRVRVAIGGSFGGHQAMEFAYSAPHLVDSLVLLVTSARETAWSIAIHESQRMAMETDPTFYDNTATAGSMGIQTARAVGLLTYRTIQAYIDTQTDPQPLLSGYRAASYVRYQGKKLLQRFHAHCYWYLAHCLDSHHMGRDRGGIEVALAQLTMPATIIGIDSDQLVPSSEQRFLAKHLPQGKYYEIPSVYGHDGFLVEIDAINAILNKHWARL